MSSLHEKLKDFCNYYHPDGIPYDEESEPTIGLFLYNCYRNILGWKSVFKTRMFFQKVFRKNHISDLENWDCFGYLARDILKRLRAFKMSNRVGYPQGFSESSDNEQKSREENNNVISDIKIIDGGSKKWEDTLDFIIRSFEYIVVEKFGTEKQKDEYFIKWYGMTPFDKTENNKYYHYDYEKDGHNYISSTTPPEGAKILSKEEFYANSELLTYVESQVQIGIELFGKYFLSLWD